MIDKKVTITEGLLNLAKIQSEMYSVANAKKRSTDPPTGKNILTTITTKAKVIYLFGVKD